MFKSISIRSKLTILVAVPLLGMLLFAAIALTTLSSARVGGPQAQRVTETQDFIADILPPPLYLVESRLVVLELYSAKGPDVRTRLEQLTKLETEFNARGEFWAKEMDDERTKDVLFNKSIPAGKDFWRVVNEQVKPAAQRGDSAGAAALDGQVDAAYQRHRDAVDELVVISRDRNVLITEEVNSSISRSTLFLTLLFFVVMGSIVAIGLAVTRAILRPVNKLQDVANRELPEQLEAIRAGGSIGERQPIDLGTNDELADAAAAFDTVVGAAIGLAEEQRALRERNATMFVNLGRRNQNLVVRQLETLDDLERNEQDATTLSRLFKVDNIATRLRRYSESLLVLAGNRPHRRIKAPVPILGVVRGALSQIEDYDRAEIGDLDDVSIVGADAVDVAHLLAELVENGIANSPPGTNVEIRGAKNGAGYMIAILDHGIGFTDDELDRAKATLAGDASVDAVANARIGLAVVAALATRHGIEVTIESTGSEGTAVLLAVPASLLTDAQNLDPVDSIRTRLIDRAATVHHDRGEETHPPAKPLERVEARQTSGSAPTNPAVVGMPVESTGFRARKTADTPENEPVHETVASTGFKKRGSSAPVVSGFDRFAEPETPNRPVQSADKVKGKLDSFSAGKTMANAAIEQESTDV